MQQELRGIGGVGTEAKRVTASIGKTTYRIWDHWDESFLREEFHSESDAKLRCSLLNGEDDKRFEVREVEVDDW